MIKVDSLAEAYEIQGMKTVACAPDGVYVQMATPEEIEAERKNKWSHIEAVRESKYANGVKVGSYWFQTSLNAKIRYMGAAALGTNFPGTDWKTMSGETTRLTGALAGQIMLAITASDAAIFKAAENHKEAMMASEDPSVYDFSSGWPETFGEYIES